MPSSVVTGIYDIGGLTTLVKLTFKEQKIATLPALNDVEETTGRAEAVGAVKAKPRLTLDCCDCIHLYIRDAY